MSWSHEGVGVCVSESGCTPTDIVNHATFGAMLVYARIASRGTRPPYARPVATSRLRPTSGEKGLAGSTLYGASVATLPTKIFDKMYNHVLTDAGLAIFEEDFKHLKE